MEYSLWYKQITTHLADYKTNVLGIPGAGYIGKAKYDYVLPRPYADFNYMIKPEGVGIKDLSDRNRLTSAKVLTVNFFLPMIANDYAFLSKFVSHYLHKEVKIVTHAFNHAPRGNGTLYFDFYCADDKGREFHFEVKYAEKGLEKTAHLGRNATDAALIETFNRIFKEQVNEPGSYLAFLTKQPLLFMKEHYSVYRHCLAANSKKNSYCFFLACNSNEETKKEIDSALKEIKGRTEHIKVLDWETAIPYAIESCAKDPNLQGYYMELRDKYLIVE